MATKENSKTKAIVCIGDVKKPQNGWIDQKEDLYKKIECIPMDLLT